MGRPLLLITCEHGGNRVPAAYLHCFNGARGLLSTHRGWDPGALMVAGRLARRLKAPLVAGTVSRLVIDLNRSLHHPRAFSRYTRPLDAERKAAIVKRIYRPYRDAVERAIDRACARGRGVIHLSVHSFTPEMNGVTRPVEIGLLYDPSRREELRLALSWQRSLRERLPDLRIRRNAPYRGTADGLTSALRRKLGPGSYIGLEIEMNQRFFRGSRAGRGRLVSAVEASFEEILEMAGRSGEPRSARGRRSGGGDGRLQGEPGREMFRANR